MRTRVVLLCTILLQWIPASVLSAPIPFARCFELASRQHDVDLDLLMAVAYQESSWKPEARSEANAHGIMQIRWPVTARHLGTSNLAELYNPCLNIDLGARYLNELALRYNGDMDLMLAAYNYGPTRITSQKDIPTGVLRYIDSVKKYRTRILKRMNSPVIGSVTESGTTIELIRFTHYRRAFRYLSSLKAHVPGAVLSLSQYQGHSIILLNVESTTASAHYRLARLLPDIYQSERISRGMH
jgi:hypothetical protein